MMGGASTPRPLYLRASVVCPTESKRWEATCAWSAGRPLEPHSSPVCHYRSAAMPDRLRIVIAEDNYLVREGTRRLLEDSGEVEVIAAVSSATELLDSVLRLHPDAVLGFKQQSNRKCIFSIIGGDGYQHRPSY